MDFTIITPSLNYGRFLRDCLESVASQEGAEFEHLILDGGSTDDSAQVAAEFAEATWVQEPDQGMSDAINKGLDRASGEWVMWLNADDRLMPGALAWMKSVVTKSRADVVYGDFEFIGEDGEVIRRIRSPKWSPFVHIHHHCLVASTSAFYRRRTVIEPGHRLRTDFRYVMDGEFYARLDQAGLRFQHRGRVIAQFRLHGENASMRHLGQTRSVDLAMAAERQHLESRVIRRVYGITLFHDPYLNGLVDGLLWIVARAWKQVRKCL